MTPVEILLLILTGVIAGGFAGSMGVGGGIIMVPVLVELLDLSQRVAQGTSLLVIVVTAAVATRSAIKRGLLDSKLAGNVALGSALGAILGAALATKVLDEVVLRRLFGIVVLAVSIRLLMRLVSTRADT
jgi:uncharacterized protein